MSTSWKILEKSKTGDIQYMRGEIVPFLSSVINSGGTVNFAKINVEGYTQGTMFFNLPSVTGSITMTLQGSNDQNNWFSMSNKTYTSVTSGGNTEFLTWRIPTKYVRLSGTSNSGTNAVNTHTILATSWCP
jgi:hypothetical protein